MQEPYRKGVATHPDPESCMASREAAIEALTGAHAGRVSSCEIIATGVPTSFSKAEGHLVEGASASPQLTPRSLRPRACMDTPRARTVVHSDWAVDFTLQDGKVVRWQAYLDTAAMAAAFAAATQAAV